MKAPKNYYSTVDQRKLGLDELDEISAKIENLKGLPDVTTDDDGKVLTVVDGKWLPFEAPTPGIETDLSKIEKTLIEEWDFTESLIGSNGSTFTIGGGTSRSSEGLAFGVESNSNQCTIPMNDILSDSWQNTIFEFEFDIDPYPGGAFNSQCMIFSACESEGASDTGKGIEFWQAWFYQPHPRTELTPRMSNVNVLRDVAVRVNSEDGIRLYGYGFYFCWNSTRGFGEELDRVAALGGFLRLGGTSSYANLSKCTLKKMRIYREVTT